LTQSFHFSSSVPQFKIRKISGWEGRVTRNDGGGSGTKQETLVLSCVLLLLLLFKPPFQSEN
jgi:hypothetical protein